MPCRTNRFRRRGASYVFFLGTAMMVMVIGMSALAVVRVKRMSAEGINDRLAAERGGQSAIESAMLSIYKDANWRTVRTNNAWSTPQVLGEATILWKLVDERSGSLTADRNAQVRVYGKGLCGPSTWFYSALFQPPPEVAPSNLLTNGDLESGAVSPWWANGCNVKLDTATKHAGTSSLLMWQRTSFTASARQTVATIIRADTAFRIKAWIRMRASAETVNVGIRVQSSAGWAYFPMATLAGTTTWQAVEGTCTPTWTGPLMDAYLEISGTTTYQEILIDDVSLKVAPSAVGIIPGSWRREMQ